MTVFPSLKIGVVSGTAADCTCICIYW